MSKRKKLERLNLALAAALMLATSGNAVMAQSTVTLSGTMDGSECKGGTFGANGECTFPVGSSGV